MITYGRAMSRWTIVLVSFVTLCVLLAFYAFPYRYNIQDTLSYGTRPLWDKSEAPSLPIAQLQAPGIASNDSDACARHGWSVRTASDTQLWDATLISTELDMLEIRLAELWDVVDVFLVMESTHTMTGMRKEHMHFAENRARFRKWEAKLRYRAHAGREQRKSDGLFTLANEQRHAMAAFINDEKPPSSTLVLMADIDEIPSHVSMGLVKACETPLPLHLQLQNYLYSFEFPTLADSWRAQVHRWEDTKSERYSHGKTTDQILTAAGWHCSFCFPTLADFKHKMLSASHIDRLLKRPNYQSYLTDTSIQTRVCQGKDLYDMPPEAFSWTDLALFWRGAQRQEANTNLPLLVVREWKRFQYLLPGHCSREPGTLDAGISPTGLLPLGGR